MSNREYSNDTFKECRVAIVVDNLETINYQTCSDKVFLDKAEEQGNTWTLQGFQKFLESGEYNLFSEKIQHPFYMIVRFIDMYQEQPSSFEEIQNNPNPVYCRDEEIIKCQWCGEECDPDEGRYEENMGFLCDTCIRALESRGEELNFVS